MSETGRRARYRYTIYREPEHRAVLEDRAAFEVERWFWKNEPREIRVATGWDYLRHRLIDGKVPGYSMERWLPDTKQKAEVSRAYVRNWEPEPVKLCGACRYWKREKARDPRTGRLYGTCNRSACRTERCAKCRCGE